jgi:peptide/nickel transport system permease protein
MIRIVARRLALSVPLLLIVSAITFVLGSLVPGDPARTLLGATAKPEQYEALRQQLNLDRPLWEQYSLYLQHLFHGDLGRSIFNNEQVGNVIATRLPVTLALIVGGTVVAALVGVALGVTSATRGRSLARSVDVISLVGTALPSFWVGLVLIATFAVALRWFPATGFTPFGVSPSLWASSLVLPVIALAIGGVALIAKITRDSMLNTLSMDYIRTLRASGIGSRSIVWRHALRNAGLPIATSIGLTMINFLPGAVFIESVFVLPGLGNTVVSATNQHDVPVVQGIGLTFTMIVIVVNLIVDVVYGFLNPKVRSE